MKFKTAKIVAIVAGMSVMMSMTAFGAEPFRSEKDKVLFASTNEKFIEKPLLADKAEMGDANAFRIPSLVNTGEALISAVDMGATGGDWGDINVAIRRSLDQGENWTAPPEIILSGVKQKAVLGAEAFESSFYIDPLMVKSSNGDVLLMVDYYPESKGLHDQKLLDGKLDAYVTIDGESYLALYAEKSKLDDKKAVAGKPYTVRESGWVYTPAGEKTKYYIPQNHSSEFSYETIGDLYFAVGDADYLSIAPPMIPANPMDDETGTQDIYVGNIYLSKNKPSFSLTQPVFVQKERVGDGSVTGKTYDAFGEYECTVSKPAPLRVSVKSYLFVTRSSDNGETWSQPIDITSSVMIDNDRFFLGTAPGVGITLSNQKVASKNGRIVMPLYALGKSVSIYSDDNGKTWQRSKSYVKNIDEWQLIELVDGTLMSFGRQNGYDITPVSYSDDGGETWSKKGYTGLMSVKCQKSVIAYPIGNDSLPSGLDKSKQYVLSSHPSGSEENKSSRSNGVISLGVVQNDNTINWLYERKIILDGQYDMLKENQKFFAYSSMTILNDGTIGIFYEAQPTSYLTYTEFNLEWVMAGEQLTDVKTSTTTGTKRIVLSLLAISAGVATLLVGTSLAIVKVRRKR